jgi:membrane protein
MKVIDTGSVKVVDLRDGGKRSGAKKLLFAAVPAVAAAAVGLLSRNGNGHGPSQVGLEPTFLHRPHDESASGASNPKAPEKEAPTGIKGKLHALGERRRMHWLGRALDVQERFSELHGNQLSAVVTLQAFLSLFPLMLFVIAVVGFIAHGGNTDVAGKIIKGLSLKGEAATTMRDAVDKAAGSRRAASVIGVVGFGWAGIGLVAALQYAYNQVWQVRERGAKDKLAALIWLVGAGILFAASGVLVGVLRVLPGWVAPIGIVVTLAVDFGLFMWTSIVLPNRDVHWRYLVPGAIMGAIGLEILKFVGAFYVPHLVKSSSALYGSIGIVFAILAWLLIFCRLLVYCATLNVVLYERNVGTTTAVIEVPDLPKGREKDATRSGRIDTVEE